MNKYESRLSQLEAKIFKKDKTRCSVIIYSNNELYIDKNKILIPTGKTKEEVITKYHLDNKIPVPPRRFVIPAFGYKQ